MEVTGPGAIKGLLRREIRSLMAELTPEEKAISDTALAARFLERPEVQRAVVLLLFYGVGKEPDTRGILDALLAQGKRVCLPRCLAEGEMEAREIHSLAQLQPDAYGIPAPGEDCPRVDKETLDVILVPNLCCDVQGYRLGQGGGYYDRYLADYTGCAIALCREDFLQSAVPRESHDKKVDLLLTEQGEPAGDW